MDHRVKPGGDEEEALRPSGLRASPWNVSIAPRSRDAISRASFGQSIPHQAATVPKAEGSGAPKGANDVRPRLRGALAFRRSTAALVAATERFDSAQAVLRATKRTRALPVPSIALKRSTPRAGRHAGRNDAQAARERGYEPRPQEPHSLHQSAVTGRRPSIGGRLNRPEVSCFLFFTTSS